MNEQVLAAVARYGLPALFTVVAIAAIGVPLPVTLLLIVTGSLAAQGMMSIWWAIAVAAAGSIAGDQIGYAIGRWGGKTLVSRLARMSGKADGLRQLETSAGKPGGARIFFSRWDRGLTSPVALRTIPGCDPPSGIFWAKRLEPRFTSALVLRSVTAFRPLRKYLAI